MAREQIVEMSGFSVHLQRKRVRNINLRVQRDGSVHVSAPARVPISAIEEFVSSRAAWIERARGRLANRAETQTVTCSEGSAIWLWGESLSCHIISIPAHGRKPGCSFEVKGTILVAHVDERICPDDQESQVARDQALHAWLREQVRHKALELLPRCEQIVGRHSSAIRVRDMTSRWGSCNVSTARITLSTHLVHHDPRCLEYVLIHELCHLHEPNHSARFHTLMNDFCPDWRERRTLLERRKA